MIYLIITTSILNIHQGIIDDEHRKITYIDSISKTLKLCPIKIKPIIVENNGQRNTYLDNFLINDNIPVIYTNNNFKKYKHKGYNELKDIHDIIEKYSINDDDIIIKITGRYHLLNDEFFKTVIDSQNDYDVFIKFYNVCSLQFVNNDCVLGLYAIRCKFLKIFKYEHTEKYNLSAEVSFATFIRNNIDRIYEIKDLGLHCCFADNLRTLIV